ncbi:hypothetical protein [Herbaspirillum huttiense]|uniref:Uncharacterized protein n=1 Tax=Herbaspirillum huttiense subsp. lycopersici TaxID=3074428 RepID=A0ABU2EPW7_9BURK|nr:hypothetical protein [Herbaspirillum huttiense]MDR9850202.1 hypothetical protein [Herbaspirillum huttiense SE1]
MRTYLALLALAAGLLGTSGAYAADTIMSTSIDWDLLGEWMLEAGRMPPG